MQIEGKTLAQVLDELEINHHLHPHMQTTPISHVLKCWPRYFHDMRQGLKRFDLRSCEDRNFSQGQYIIQREWDPEIEKYTGLWDLYYVQYVLTREELSNFIGSITKSVIMDLIHVIGNG